MRKGNAIFKQQGSKGEDDSYEIKGGEFLRAMKLIDYKFRLAVSIFFAAVSGAAPILMNVFMGDMVTSLVGDDPNAPQYNPSIPKDQFAEQMKHYLLDTVTDLSLRMVYIIVAMTFVQALNFYARAAIGPTYVTSLRKMIFKSIMNQDIAFFDRTASGILISRLSEDVTLVRETYIEKLIMIIQNLIQAIASLILAFVYSWKVTLVVLAFIPVAGGAFLIGERIVDRMWSKFSDKTSKASSKAEEVITSFRTVKAFDNELYEAEIYSENLWGVHAVLKSTSLAKGIQSGIVQFLTWGMVAALMYYGGYLVIHGEIESGNVIVLFASLLFAAMGLSMATASMDDFKKAQVAAGKILQVVDEKPFIDRYEGKEMTEIEGKIEFDDVSFKYASRDDYAVNHLSFTINPGETVALVGESGCGKTTTLALIQRFYEIESGSIKIDGVDIREYSQHSLRSHIAVVPQGPVLFSMSVKDNIRFAKPSEKSEKVGDAARVGNAHDFIMDLPENYDTIIQQTNLSGGQKQRICIARAILANTPILMLDEATAALDTESERLVQQSLENFRHGKTAIVVAHRLSTVKNADRIFVFQNGKIVETGKHEELLEQSGIYADLVKFQLQ